MAHKKGVGSTDNGRDSKPKYLGVKLFGGQEALAGNIIVRQRGTKFHPGTNVYMGKDYTLHARVDGTVVFRKQAKGRTYVSIRPSDAETASQTRSILGTREFANEGKAAQKPARDRCEGPKPPARAPNRENGGGHAAQPAQHDQDYGQHPLNRLRPGRQQHPPGGDHRFLKLCPLDGEVIDPRAVHLAPPFTPPPTQNRAGT